ncbi:Mip1p [Malassezia vespertilionis]|uniref:Mitochondrial DNA polymerase catalytic subunit n=1 Tax=Malassezia vespertilionis TaxID=2020962 RepID=A0A2N1JCG0_9BASI|nr:Mip1p [Malassezia vespertilionis]
MVNLAAYYCFCDLILLWQWWYYGTYYRAGLPIQGRGGETHSNEATEGTSLLRNRNGAVYGVCANVKRLCDTMMRYFDRLTPVQFAACKYGSNVGFVVVTGIIAWCSADGSVDSSPRPPSAIHEKYPKMRWDAQLLGWLSATLYIASRIPQIFKNRHTKCAGLSLALFVFAVGGNVTPVAQGRVKQPLAFADQLEAVIDTNSDEERSDDEVYGEPSSDEEDCSYRIGTAHTHNDDDKPLGKRVLLPQAAHERIIQKEREAQNEKTLLILEGKISRSRSLAPGRVRREGSHKLPTRRDAGGAHQLSRSSSDYQPLRRNNTMTTTRTRDHTTRMNHTPDTRLNKELGRVHLQQPPQYGTVTHRVFVLSQQRYAIVHVRENANAHALLQQTVFQMGLAPCTDAHQDWAVWDVLTNIGIERPLREYERVHEVVAERGTDVGHFLIKPTDSPTLVHADTLPTYSSMLGGWVSIQTDPKKWSKRWLELREHHLFIATSENGKHEEPLASMFETEFYFMDPVRQQAIKPYGFALRKTSVAPDTADRTIAYVTQPSLAAHRDWAKAIFGARTYVIRQERPQLLAHVLQQGQVTKSLDTPCELKSATAQPALHAPTNPVGVQLLERSLHRQIFCTTNTHSVDPMALDICLDHLDKHALHASKASKLTPTTFTLPPLQGKDISEHFWTIGRRAAQPWMGFATQFANDAILPPPQPHSADADSSVGWSPEAWRTLDLALRAGVPLRPTSFSTEPGWTKYAFLRTEDGELAGLDTPQRVAYPDVEDSALVFDVEVLVTESPYPVMATAVSNNAWYSWVSPYLAEKGARHTSPAHLIPLGPEHDAPPRLVICHNAGYDRATVLDEYCLKSSNIRWLDTMSLHVATSGISSPQRAAWIVHARSRSEKRSNESLATKHMEDDMRADIGGLFREGEFDPEALARLNIQHMEGWSDALKERMREHYALLHTSFEMPGLNEGDALSTNEDGSVLWQDITAQNSLADVAALHCGIHLNKDARNYFIDGTSKREIRARCEELLAYCATDVETTFAVFKKVWPAFVRNCPHPATTAGVLGLGSTFLPVDSAWIRYKQQANAKFDEMNANIVSTLKHLAHTLKDAGIAAINAMHAGSQAPHWWEEDPWYAQLDWSPKKPKRGSADENLKPAWWRNKVAQNSKALGSRHAIVPLLLRLRLDGNPLVPNKRQWVAQTAEGDVVLDAAPLSQAFLSKAAGLTSGAGSDGAKALEALAEGDKDNADRLLREIADALSAMDRDTAANDPQLSLLDWTMVPYTPPEMQGPAPWWPKWYWDIYSAKDKNLELTIRTKTAPILLKLAWDGHPIFRSRQHGWMYRTQSRSLDKAEGKTPLTLDPALDPFAISADTAFYKLPHANGDGSNVGNPFSKSFLPYFESGKLASMHSETGEQAAKRAVEMNAMCSYWISVRDRVEKQLVVWDGEAGTDMGMPHDAQRGLILPQVIPMGTVTRRAIEKTWLTASNAKKNRIGSELKSMVRAPPGWSIVGADVDSEELWICSVMGDAQFGLHGATAIGWMTLEGSKTLGTDLHSKTASILGTSRDQAKVFNYSRIYGAGIRHATQLLLKASPSMPLEEATRRAKQLYAATKGKSSQNGGMFGRKFWFGGSESHVFNKLEEIATSDNPRTPALDCGITSALSKKYLPRASDGGVRQDYMPSRINWVVQSSGVDYLHLLITAMDHLCATYDIDARFMLSVHDEVRYMAKDHDRYRAGMALQIANLWTRAMFVSRLGMDELPESCAFFAAVDIDRVLRKEVDDPCVTPSQPDPIPEGESLGIADILAKTCNGSLHKDGRPMENDGYVLHDGGLPTYTPTIQKHRCTGNAGLLFLQAQSAQDIQEVRALDRRARRSASTRQTRAYTTQAPQNKRVFIAMESMLPPRPIHYRRPFFARVAYRRHVLHLYARILRALRRIPSHAKAQLSPLVRARMRAKKRYTSAAQCLDACAEGESLANTFEHGTDASLDNLAVTLAVRARAPKPSLPTRKIHVSGALLAPTLFNAPMLRYKPDQPLSMTMMIRDRRRRREKRMQRMAVAHETQHMIEEEAAHLGTLVPVLADVDGWSKPVQAHKQAMHEQFQSEYRRAAMVFRPAMLARAKQARRAKHAYRTKKK